MKINEIFGPTIQGEGIAQGTPTLFLRLALCNLYCEWCDTPFTWNWKGTSFKHPQKYDYNKEVHEMNVEQVLNELYKRGQDRIKHLVISGGEPTMQFSRKDVIELLKILDADGWYKEVETNGTLIVPNSPRDYIQQWNVSPKLSNSGNSLRERERSKALWFYRNLPNSWFKYVIETSQDLQEVDEQVERYDIPKERILLMPQAKTQQDLQEKSAWLINEAIKNGYRFSTRLHIYVYGNKRGV